MLDTNIVSALVRNPAGPVATRIASLAEPVSISIVVAAELSYGASRRQSKRLDDAVARVLGAIDIEPLSPPAERIYGALRAGLEREGRPMDANDLLIAAHALALDRLLVTADQAFARVRGLRLENWLA